MVGYNQLVIQTMHCSWYEFLIHGCCYAAFVSLCDHSHIACNCVHFNQTALRAVRFVCVYTLRVCFLLSPFEIVLVAVWITVWIYFNRLQNTAALELNYFVFETFYLLPFFGIRESASRVFWLLLLVFYDLDNCLK